jgi:4a-hydroxytetrahydrobiopterin dehydratase
MLYFKEKDQALQAEFEIHPYLKALSFVSSVGCLAEEHNHHPDIHLSYGKVQIRITTHDAGNTVTDKDYQLAEAIEKAFGGLT